LLAQGWVFERPRRALCGVEFIPENGGGALAMKAKPSVDFGGYWQRHIAA
jgi:hypothetical protein